MRCAIYTRKSTSAGLEKDFNSLDAQREACVAYVHSQASRGWVALEEAYNDGGFTGANTDRPGFQKLLEHISQGHVDLVVVYKVDRLSRSLVDFAKVMEHFNRHQVAFASITQNFSTADPVRNRLYVGEIACLGEFVAAEHPPLISRELFEQVQRLMKPRYYPSRVLIQNPDYLVRGTLRCGVCQGLMTSASTRRKDRVFRYYRCATRDIRGAKACPTRQLPAEAIEGFVVEKLQEALNLRNRHRLIRLNDHPGLPG